MNTTNSPSRRFLRIETLNNLYIYHIARQIHFQECIEQIKLDFIPNSIAKIKEDRIQLQKDTEESINLFKDFIKTEETFSKFTHPNPRILASVSNSYYNYKARTKVDYNHIKTLLSKVEHDINEIVLTILQLLIEWQKMALQKNFITDKPPIEIKLIQKLQNNSIIEKLSSDLYFQENLKKYSIDWKKELYHAEDWLSSIYLNSENISQCDINSEDPRFIYNFVSNILLESPLIIDFFERKYILWHRLDFIIKDLLQNILRKYIADTEKKFKFTREYLFMIDVQSSEFYKKLLDTFLSKEIEINEILEKKLENWDLDRVILLDKIIAKLALCEILFFTEIPRKVSINEYIEIAKIYGNEQSGKFINGILDAPIMSTAAVSK